MDRAGIVVSVLLPPPQSPEQVRGYDYNLFRTSLAKYPGRFSWLGGGRILNQMIQAHARRSPVNSVLEEFERRATEIIERGAAGFGEITAHHYSYRHDHPYESVPADSPLLLLLADIAARHDAVIDFHFDPVVRPTRLPAWMPSPPNPPSVESNIRAFERLVAHNARAKFVWAHMGSDPLGHWTPELSRELLEKYPNLNMSIRLGKLPSQSFDPGWSIDKEWLRLFNDYPDRFVIGGDQFIVSTGFKGGGPGIAFSEHAQATRERTRDFLLKLPPHLRHKFAVENAVRLYKLPK
jgi:predicted TIM-barrel fold metal-dependent hydrolase